ncbi:hypothetical protein PHYBOEH_008374 [Phytophthora boehmeriae]|uniref:Uncharacterized protein n=1 Tax=Phytophthora boehmeriae TaxID=109152 RepID=A0A8T1VZW7_9STRA|nr:hypothetical protein PHYBOEH_008374 [Phytophthora boehmeriae]
MPKDDALASKASIASASVCGTRRRLLSTLALILLLLGALSMVARVVDLSAATNSFSASEKSSVMNVRGVIRHNGYAQKNTASSNGANAAKSSSPGSVEASRSGLSSQQALEQEQAQEKKKQALKELVVQRTKAPHDYSTQETKNKCYMERDVGIITAVKQSARKFCPNGGWDKQNQKPVSPEQATKVTMFRVPGGIRSATFQNLMMDFTGVEIHAPIKSMAEDGGKHDPRFNFNPRLINCACDELANHYRKLPGDKERKDQQIWQPSLMSFPGEGIPFAGSEQYAGV